MAMNPAKPNPGVSGTAPGTMPAPGVIAANSDALESLTQRIGRELLHAARRQRTPLISSRFWSEQLLTWAMHDPQFKVGLLRFVDVFPMLRHPGQVYEYLTEYLGQAAVGRWPWLERLLGAGRLAKGIVAAGIERQIKALASLFIAGSDAAAALGRLRELWQSGSAFSVDLLGEACVSLQEARTYQSRYLELVHTLAEATAHWPAQPRLERDPWGPVPRANISLKPSALWPRIDPADFEGTLRALEEAAEPILQAAARHGVSVHFDMEQYALKDLTLALVERCCKRVDFSAGVALQAYLRSGPDDARRLIAWTQSTGRQLTVRLIKGAYWDSEVVRARQENWPVPVWTDKRKTDACFEEMAAMLLAAAPPAPDRGGIKLAIGSHNVRSIARALALAEHHGLPPEAVEIQMLYGMALPVQAAVLARGLRLRVYVPLGELVPGMAYLVRRLLENTSNQSWLRAGFVEQADEATLLAPPMLPAEIARPVPPPVPAAQETFANEPHRDFADAGQRAHFAEAVWTSRLPAVPAPVAPEEVDRRVRQALEAQAAWQELGCEGRAAILCRAAAAMRKRRDELAGMVIREAGKTWREADADVCEAIDFLEYYARQARQVLAPRSLGPGLGETNQLRYLPRGVAAVICPWNFPAAILTGMTAACLVAGNAVLLKPSGQTPAIAWAISDILWQSGVPGGVLQYLHGPGRTLGAALVRHPQVALVAFTGSKEVGLDILQVAGQVDAQQPAIKKVVCEMGGKNAIVVDESADLDEAVLGVRQSAFGYSGQKCSACSRAIVVEAVYGVFLHRLIESTRSLVLGDPLEPGTDIGPVIDAAAVRKIHEYIALGMEEGRLELACPVPEGLESRVGKPFVGPHIFSGIRPEHRLAQEEIFGPVLAVMRVADFDQALDWANRSGYRLCGGVYSRKPSHLEEARRRFRVGNLYLNRPITGARVGRQPFGGFGLSGTGTQAGGPDYLLHFVLPQAVAENTLRHGFAPELD